MGSLLGLKGIRNVAVSVTKNFIGWQSVRLSFLCTVDSVFAPENELTIGGLGR